MLKLEATQCHVQKEASGILPEYFLPGRGHTQMRAAWAYLALSLSLQALALLKSKVRIGLQGLQQLTPCH